MAMRRLPFPAPPNSQQSGRTDVKVTSVPAEHWQTYVHQGVIESIVLWEHVGPGLLAVYASRAVGAGQLKLGDQSVGAGRLAGSRSQMMKFDSVLPLFLTRETSTALIF